MKTTWTSSSAMPRSMRTATVPARSDGWYKTSTHSNALHESARSISSIDGPAICQPGSCQAPSGAQSASAASRHGASRIAYWTNAAVRADWVAAKLAWSRVLADATSAWARAEASTAACSGAVCSP